jgi:hypothetical protein
MKYKITRFYMNGPPYRRVINTGLTREQAEEHCSDPETSSSTCKKSAGRRRTKSHGPWFDGFEEDR